MAIKVLGPIGFFSFKASKWPPDVAQSQVNTAIPCVKLVYYEPLSWFKVYLSDYKSVQLNCAVTSIIMETILLKSSLALPEPFLTHALSC